MTAATLFDAFKARLVAGLPGTVAVWDTKRPDVVGPDRHHDLPGVVLRCSPGAKVPVHLSGDSTSRTSTFWTVAVGDGPDQVRGVRAAVETAVLDARLVVTGLTCGPVKHPDADVTAADDAEHPLRTLYRGVDVWTVWNFPS